MFSKRYEMQMKALAPFSDELLKQTDEGGTPGDDKKLAAGYESVLARIWEEDEYEFRDDIINNLLDKEAPGYGAPNQAVPKIIRGIMTPVLRHRKEWNFPASFDTPEKWLEAQRWIEDDPQLKEDFDYNMRERFVASNIQGRYKTIPMVTGMLRERYGRFEEPISVADFGSSLRLGLFALMSQLHAKDFLVNDEHDEKDDDLTSYFKSLIRARNIGRAVGVDLFDYKEDPKANEWAIGCRGYPSEWQEKDLLKEADALSNPDEKTREKITGVEADITSRESLKNAGLEEGSQDVVFIATTLYEVEPTKNKRSLVIDNALWLAKEKGVVIRQDFGYVNSLGRFRLYKHHHDKPYKYCAAVNDKARPKRGLEEYFRFKNARCNEMQLMAGAKAVLNGSG